MIHGGGGEGDCGQVGHGVEWKMPYVECLSNVIICWMVFPTRVPHHMFVLDEAFLNYRIKCIFSALSKFESILFVSVNSTGSNIVSENTFTVLYFD